MHEETLEFQKLREAVISAQMQTGAKLTAEWVYEDEDGLEAFRILDLESEDDHRRHVRMVWPELDGPRVVYGGAEAAVAVVWVDGAAGGAAGVCLPE